MRHVRLNDLGASFTSDGFVRVRSWGHGLSVRLSMEAMAVLAYCSAPREEEDVRARLGQRSADLYGQLVAAGLLVDPDQATRTPVFFRNFGDIDPHRRMLADRVRVEAYRRALAEVAPGQSVLDAGTGSGVLAGLSALGGANRVTAIDNAEIVDAAAENMRRSGLDGVVNVARADISDVVLADPVDVIVTETFGAMAYVEGAAADLRACIATNLAPDGIVVPNRIDLYLAPVHEPAVRDFVLSPYEAVDGLNLSALRDVAIRRGTTMPVPSTAVVGKGECLVSASFPEAGGGSGAVSFACPDTVIVGFVGWFDLHLSPNEILSTSPHAPPTHWEQTFFPLPDLPVGPEGVLAVQAEIGPAPDDRRACVMKIEWSLDTARSGSASYRLG